MKYFIASPALFLLLLFFTLSCRFDQPGALKVAEVPPDFQLPDIDGSIISLKESKGKVVLLEFWATWCSPCVDAIPFLNSLYDNYRDKGLTVLAINLDGDNGVGRVKDFAKEYDIKYPILFSDDLTGKLYGVSNIPVTFIIDREHKVAGKYYGASPRIKSVISEKIKELL